MMEVKIADQPHPSWAELDWFPGRTLEWIPPTFEVSTFVCVCVCVYVLLSLRVSLSLWFLCTLLYE